MSSQPYVSRIRHINVQPHYWLVCSNCNLIVRLTFNPIITSNSATWNFVFINEAIILISECQGGADGKGLSCQSGCWQIEYRLCQVDKKQAFNSTFLGLSDQDLNLEASCTTMLSLKIHLGSLHIGKSVKAARCCQNEGVALCISPDYTDSGYRGGRY